MRKTSKSVYMLCLAALFVALDIVFTRIIVIPYIANVRVSPQFLSYGLAGWLLGPWWAMAVAAVGDVLGVLVNVNGAFVNPLITLIAAGKGLIYGLLLYKKPPHMLRALLAVAIAEIGFNLGLNSLALVPIYGLSWFDLVIMRAPVILLSVPVYGALLFAVQKGLALAKVREA